MNTVTSSSDATGTRSLSTGAYKDIAVHPDGGEQDEIRLAHAEQLCVLFGARLTGLFTNMLPDPAIYSGDFGISAMGELTEAAIEEGNATKQKLEQRFARLGVANELRRIDAFPGVIEQAVANEARCSDLFVAGPVAGGP